MVAAATKQENFKTSIFVCGVWSGGPASGPDPGLPPDTNASGNFSLPGQTLKHTFTHKNQQKHELTLVVSVYSVLCRGLMFTAPRLTVLLLSRRSALDPGCGRNVSPPTTPARRPLMTRSAHLMLRSRHVGKTCTVQPLCATSELLLLYVLLLSSCRVTQQ